MHTQYRIDTDVAKLLRRRAGAHLRGLRVDAGLTQQQVAKALGWDYYTMVSQIERGISRLPPEEMPLYAATLGVDLATMAQELLAFYDPHMHAAIFGDTGQIKAVKAELKATKSHAKRSKTAE